MLNFFKPLIFSGLTAITQPAHADPIPPADPIQCADLSMGHDFIAALSQHRHNLFTDPNHEDFSIQSFFASPAIADCMQQADINALFTENSSSSRELYQRMIAQGMSVEDFSREVLGDDYDTATQIKKDLLEIRYNSVFNMTDHDIDVVPSDILEGSEIAILYLMSLQQAFQAWSNILPEEDREAFLNWSIHGIATTEEVKRGHLEIIAANQESPDFIRGQSLFETADELKEMGAVDERLNAEGQYAQSVIETAEQDGFENFAIMRGEGHFTSQTPIQSFLPESDTTIFCLRSEFTHQEIPEETCDYVINTSSFTLEPQLP